MRQSVLWSGTLVKPAAQSRAVSFAGANLCAEWSTGHRWRRDARATSWQAHQSQRHLPGCGTLKPPSFCQSQWTALVEPDAAECDSLCAAYLGLTVPDRASAIRTLSSTATPSAHNH